MATILQRGILGRGRPRLARTKGDQTMFEPIRNRLRLWHLRHVARRRLSMLDDRLLADIGTRRSGIAGFVAMQTGEEK
jgi:uncharacterized protein YjiS (DUF1127 family)